MKQNTYKLNEYPKTGIIAFENYDIFYNLNQYIYSLYYYYFDLYYFIIYNNYFFYQEGKKKRNVNGIINGKINGKMKIKKIKIMYMKKHLHRKKASEKKLWQKLKGN